MGYTTNFNGLLEFTKPPTVEELRLIESISGEDSRDHEEWGKQDFYYLDLQVNDYITGIEHTDAEKSYGVVEQVNFLIKKVKEISPDFGLKGSLMAQGENVGDVWRLRIKDGLAVQEDVIEDDDYKWISVDDRLPYDDCQCLGYFDDAMFGKRIEMFSFRKGSGEWATTHGWNREPTHWQPLPEPPKGEDDE